MDASVVADLNQAAINGIRAAGATTQLILVEGTHGLVHGPGLAPATLMLWLRSRIPTTTSPSRCINILILTVGDERYLRLFYHRRRTSESSD